MKPAQADKEVVEHWYSLVAGQNFSSKDFYSKVEEVLLAQRLPALSVARVDLSEGGVLSDKREYLRMQRERIIFDVCAAPVGTNYFFSYRFYALLPVVKPWEVVVALFFLSAALHLLSKFAGFFLGPVLLLVMLGFLVWLMRNAIGMGLRDIDLTLLKIPIVAPIYERYFRRDTYYRQDMRLAYGLIVGGIVKQEVGRVTAANGVQLLREYSYSPIFDGLYKSKEITPTIEEPDDRQV
jgi:hypothetical protein